LHDGLDRVRLFGLELVNAPSLGLVLDTIVNQPASSNPSVVPMVVTPNVDIVVHLDRAPESIEADVFRRAQYALPDGMPLVTASRLVGTPLESRLTGSGLFELMWPRLAAEQRPAVVLCASDEIARFLAAEHGSARFVVPPMLDTADPVQVDAVVDELIEMATSCSAQFVLLGLGHPKDAVLAARLNQRWPAGAAGDAPPRPLCCGLGGAFAMYAGLKRRAPVWVQQAGLEWLYRFAQEPRRLFRRYFVRDLAFFGIVAREYRASRAVRRQA
jgi:N-acetylglucosaminyldiphosphoundecaprenol N-acetyl-beta-D-mannosaminyltransferase